MDIYIKWDNDSKSIQIPILPESFAIEDSMNNTTINIHNLGDINLKGKRGLYGLSFESFFPDQKYGFERGIHHDPYDYYIKKLKDLFENNTTLHVVITETNINGHFTIESLTYGHSEKTKDVNYSIGFREYRSLSTTSDGSSKSGRVSKTKETKTVSWKKGDTWQRVTKTVLGSSKTYKAQKKNNKSVVKKAMKKHPKKKEKDALVGYKVVIKA